jgi:hypothetical protein
MNKAAENSGDQLHEAKVKAIIDLWKNINLCSVKRVRKDGLMYWVMDYSETHFNHPRINEEHGSFLREHFPFGIGPSFKGRLSKSDETLFFVFAQQNPIMWQKFRQYVATLASSMTPLDGFILTFLSSDLNERRPLDKGNQVSRRKAHLKIRNTLLRLTCLHWKTEFQPFPLFRRKNAASRHSIYGSEIIVDALLRLRPNEKKLSVETLKDIYFKPKKYIGV